MEARWGWEAKAALGCVLLLPVWVCITGLNSNVFWEVMLCGLLGFGLGFGLAVARRGSRASRWASAICVAVLLVVAVGHVILVRTDPWLSP